MKKIMLSMMTIGSIIYGFECFSMDRFLKYARYLNLDFWYKNYQHPVADDPFSERTKDYVSSITWDRIKMLNGSVTPEWASGFIKDNIDFMTTYLNYGKFRTIESVLELCPFSKDLLDAWEKEANNVLKIEEEVSEYDKIINLFKECRNLYHGDAQLVPHHKKLRWYIAHNDASGLEKFFKNNFLEEMNISKIFIDFEQEYGKSILCFAADRNSAEAITPILSRLDLLDNNVKSEVSKAKEIAKEQGCRKFYKQLCDYQNCTNIFVRNHVKEKNSSLLPLDISQNVLQACGMLSLRTREEARNKEFLPLLQICLFVVSVKMYDVFNRLIEKM